LIISASVFCDVGLPGQMRPAAAANQRAIIRHKFGLFT
jgi:hypothetical protein